MILKRLSNNGIPEYNLNEIQLSMKAQVEAKIDNGTYQFESVDHCSICNSSDAELLSEKERYGLYLPVKVCKGCGFVYTSPRMNQAAYNEFYNSEYRKLYGGSEKPTIKFFQSQLKKGKKIYNFISSIDSNLKPDGFVLEVGCGAGGILKYFNEKGFKVKGIDLGIEYIEYGRTEHGLDLESGFLKDLKLDTKPDVIIYSHVVEHLLDLKEELELIRSICHENTIVYIEVPGIKQVHLNYERNILKYFQNAHTYHFTLTSLENLFGKFGFKLIKGNEFVMSAFKVDSTNSNFKNDYKNVIEYIVKNENSRLGYFFTVHGMKMKLKSVAFLMLDSLGLREPLKKMLGKT